MKEFPEALELMSAQIARLSLKPSDTLVIRLMDRNLPHQTIDRVRQIVRQGTDHQKVLILTDGAEISVLEAADE